jgi:hypothetical protein
MRSAHGPVDPNVVGKHLPTEVRRNPRRVVVAPRDDAVAWTAMKLFAFCVCAVSIFAAACCKSTSEESLPGDEPGGVTITRGADGGTRVLGGKKMTGSPKDCTAFRACCTAPEAGLFCGLAEASGQDCAAGLTSVRNFLKERGASPPAGCM